MPRNNGKLSEKLFDDMYTFKPGVVVYSFVDTHRARNFVPTQPADRLLIYEGQAWLCEIKSSMDKVRFPLKNISKKQVGYGRFWRTAGAKEVFIIHHIVTDKFYFIPFNLVDEWFKEGVSSVKWDDILVWQEDNGYEFYNNRR